MPRAYTEGEKRRIREDLKREALSCLPRYGVRKTTVDELVRRVHIPKGTFYLFYESKEILLFEALNEEQERIQNILLEELGRLTEYSADAVTEVIFKLYKIWDETELSRLMNAGEMELLVRKLPEEMIKQHFELDARSFDKLLEVIPGVSEVRQADVESAFRAVFCTMLCKKEIGEEYFDNAVKLLIKGIVLQLGMK